MNEQGAIEMIEGGGELQEKLGTKSNLAVTYLVLVLVKKNEDHRTVDSNSLLYYLHVKAKCCSLYS